MDHIDAMDQLRQGFIFVHMVRSIRFVSTNSKALKCSRKWLTEIEEEVATYIMKAQIESNLKREKVAEGKAVNPKEEGSTKPKPVKKKQDIGRNDPCPCGSGKKYKNCHGKVD